MTVYRLIFSFSSCATSCNDELRTYSVRSGFQQLVALLVDSCVSALLAMGFGREVIGNREVEIVARLVHVVERPVMTFARAAGRAGEETVCEYLSLESTGG